MANKCANLEASAHPANSKRNTCIQECLRRFKTTSRELPEEFITNTMVDYMGELAQGGYSKQWRQQVLEDALTGYKRFWAMEHEGTGHVNRPEGATANKRRAERKVGKSTWFMKPPNKNNKVKVSCNSTFKVKTKCRSKVPNKTETVLFIPFTPNSSLKRKLQEAEFR